MTIILWAVIGLAAGYGSITFLHPFLLILGCMALGLPLTLIDRERARMGHGVALASASLPIGLDMLVNLDFEPWSFALSLLLLAAGVTKATLGARGRGQFAHRRGLG